MLVLIFNLVVSFCNDILNLCEQMTALSPHDDNKFLLNEKLFEKLVELKSFYSQEILNQLH